MPTSKTILRYALVHVAELAMLVGALLVVDHYLNIPLWLTIAVVAAWIAKDIALFPKVWRAYAFGDNSPMRKLIGLEGTVTDGLSPVGYVKVRGELWKAEISDPRYPATRGDRTRVVDVKGMTLVVERCNDHGAPIG